MLPACYFDTPIGRDLTRHLRYGPDVVEILHGWHNKWRFPHEPGKATEPNPADFRH